MRNQDPSSFRSPILVLGPAYSGKSSFASSLLDSKDSAVILGTAPTLVQGLAPRVGALKSRRPNSWTSLDVDTDLSAALVESANLANQVLVDSVSQWMSSLIGHAGRHGDVEAEIFARAEDLLKVLRSLIQDETLKKPRLVLVSAEFGAGLPPSSSAERLLRCTQGVLNQNLAMLCHTVICLAAGIPNVIKGP